MRRFIVTLPELGFAALPSAETAAQYTTCRFDSTTYPSLRVIAAALVAISLP
jgi:hypothetical protein